MKRDLLLLLLISGVCLTGRAQGKFEPAILVLSPASVSATPNLSAEIKSLENKMKESLAKMVPDVGNMDAGNKSTPENIRLAGLSTRAYIKHMDVYKQAALMTQGYLLYRFYEKFTNTLILLKDTVSNGQPDDLQRMARSQQVEYVLNFPSMVFYKKDGADFARLKVQLYELSSNSVVLEKEYTGDWNNPGFEFGCEQATLGCTINNALSQALEDIIGAVAANNPTLKREKALYAQRTKVLMSQYYPQAWDSALLCRVIAPADSTIALKDLYYCLYDEQKNKFVAFFIRQVSKKGLKSMTGGNENATIITGKDIHDPGYLDDIPQTYAYVVKGVNYRGKWYYAKDKSTYFEAKNLEEGKQQYFNNLQQWDFFRNDATVINPDFWEGILFNKIPDRRKDPNWEKYKEMWQSEERENKDYIGMYEWVAAQLKEEQANADKAFAKETGDGILRPFYDAAVKANTWHINSYTTILDECILIYPTGRHIVLNPIVTKSDKGTDVIRYFVFMPSSGEIYEWTYFEPRVRQHKYATDDITAQLRELTQWSFAYRTLDDEAFWARYVLLREGGAYKYLKKVQ